MKSAIFRAVQPVWGKRIHVLCLCVRYKCLSKPQHMFVSSPQSAPVARSLAMYRDPLTGPIVNVLAGQTSMTFSFKENCAVVHNAL